jgi:hypothetical protein
MRPVRVRAATNHPACQPAITLTRNDAERAFRAERLRAFG